MIGLVYKLYCDSVMLLNTTSAINTPVNVNTGLDTVNKNGNLPETNTNIVVAYRGAMYDITAFAKKHPGGKSVLIDNNGNNIEQLMSAVGHSAHAYKLLEKYKISDM